MILSLIIAVDENNLIGAKNDLPWNLPEDLKRFKEITMGHPIIMGRKTFESIGRVLPGRENIIITRNKDYTAEGTTVLHSIEEMINHVKNEDEAFIIGGAQLFKEAISHISKMYLTEIHQSFEGDVYLPELNIKNWNTESSEEFPKTETRPHSYRFSILTK